MYSRISLKLILLFYNKNCLSLLIGRHIVPPSIGSNIKISIEYYGPLLYYISETLTGNSKETPLIGCFSVVAQLLARHSSK
jgi:hypothetical protein